MKRQLPHMASTKQIAIAETTTMTRLRLDVRGSTAALGASDESSRVSSASLLVVACTGSGGRCVLAGAGGETGDEGACAVGLPKCMGSVSTTLGTGGERCERGGAGASAGAGAGASAPGIVIVFVGNGGGSAVRSVGVGFAPGFGVSGGGDAALNPRSVAFADRIGGSAVGVICGADAALARGGSTGFGGLTVAGLIGDGPVTVGSSSIATSQPSSATFGGDCVSGRVGAAAFAGACTDGTATRPGVATAPDPDAATRSARRAAIFTDDVDFKNVATRPVVASFVFVIERRSTAIAAAFG